MVPGSRRSARSTADRLEELVATIGQEMDRGSGVLAFTVASIDDPETVTDRLGVDREGLVRVDVPATLRAEIDRALGS